MQLLAAGYQTLLVHLISFLAVLWGWASLASVKLMCCVPTSCAPLLHQHEKLLVLEASVTPVAAYEPWRGGKQGPQPPP